LVRLIIMFYILYRTVYNSYCLVPSGTNLAPLKNYLRFGGSNNNIFSGPIIASFHLH